MADRDRLKKAFDLVCDPDDWRKKIDKTLYLDSKGKVVETGVTIDEVREAIVFFTATEPTAKEVPASVGIAVRVTSVGYRAGPAGP